VAGTWSPTLVPAPNAALDSWVTIGGNAGDFGNSTSYGPTWGSPGANQAGIPANAQWFNQHPPNLQGRVNASTLKTLIGQFVFKNTIFFFATPITVGYNQGIGTPAQFGTGSLLGMGPFDSDGDGVWNSFDNCPFVANPDQADCDGDSLGDACETDPDANLNGIRDNCESGTLVFSVPQHFATVASAVAAATTNSIVRVGPGTYPERIDFAGKAITVESTGGAAATVLDGGGQPGSIVSFLSGEGPGSVLRGFTIRNGVGGPPLPQAPWQYTVGGGIHINLSSPTVEDCVVENCSAPSGGGVIIYRSSAVLRRCAIRDNDASENGGGLFLFRPYGALVDDCLIAGNHAAQEGGGIMAGFGWATITGSELDANTAGGTGSALRWRYADPEPTEPPFLTVEGCVIRDNLSTGGGGAAIAALPVPATISLENLEFCRNSPENLEGAFLDLGGSFTCGCPADVNLDHEVGAEDLATVIGFWGPCAAPCAADLDDNGVVDANDLAVVIGGWGACP
jgi:hypothetical protein